MVDFAGFSACLCYGHCFFSFAPKDASFWRPLSVLQCLHGVQWWTARCWMESDVLPHPHDPGKERKGMKGDGTACHVSECWVFGVEMYRCHDAITTMTCFHWRSRTSKLECLYSNSVMYTVSLYIYIYILHLYIFYIKPHSASHIHNDVWKIAGSTDAAIRCPEHCCKRSEETDTSQTS